MNDEKFLFHIAFNHNSKVHFDTKKLTLDGIHSSIRSLPEKDWHMSHMTLGNQWWLSDNPKTPPDILHVLAHSKWSSVRSGVALNQNADSRALDVLSYDKDFSIAHEAARHPNISDTTLHRLSQHQSRDVVYDAIKNLKSRGVKE